MFIIKIVNIRYYYRAILNKRFFLYFKVHKTVK